MPYKYRISFRSYHFSFVIVLSSSSFSKKEMLSLRRIFVFVFVNRKKYYNDYNVFKKRRHFYFFLQRFGFSRPILTFFHHSNHERAAYIWNKLCHISLTALPKLLLLDCIYLPSFICVWLIMKNLLFTKCGLKIL